MRYKPVNLIGGFNTDEAVPWAVEDTVNFIPEKASSEGNRTPAKLRSAPGLKPYAQIGPSPIRGMHNAEGKLFVVSGTKLYQISNTGVAIPLGTVPGVQRVTMAHNQIVGGNQIIVNTGTPNGYVYSTVTQIFGKITDPGYPGGGSVDYIDTYLVQVEPFGRYFFWSAQSDALNYNTLDRAEAEASPDGIVGLAVNNFEVIVFGKSTVEFFYNAGTTTGTFKSKRVWIEHGCAGRDTIASMDNTLYWLSPERILYRLNGYNAEPVSTPQFEEAIAGYDYANAFAFVYEDQGHKIYYLTFPDGKTFGFDVTTGLMHRRESYGLKRWRLNALANWNRGWYGGDFQSGKIYQVDWDYMLEGESTELVSTRTTGVLSLNQNRITIPHVEVLVDSGQPETVGVVFPVQPEPPTITGAAPDGSVGTAYAGYAYTLADGTPPYTVTLRSGALPDPLTISSAGVISTDTPTQAGKYTFTLRNTDKNSLWYELGDEILITYPALALGLTSVSVSAMTLSASATDWSNPTTTPPFGAVYLIGTKNQRFLSWSGTTAYYTDDFGANWITATGGLGGSGGPRFGSSYNGIVLIAGGSNGLYRSIDNGENYSNISSGVGTSNSTGIMEGLAISVQYTVDGVMRYSLNDGASWAGSTALTGMIAASGGIAVITHDDEKFYIATPITGGIRVWATDNGITTTHEDMPVVAATYANGIAVGNGVMIVGGENGEIYRKVLPSGAWALIPHTFGTQLETLTFNGALFIAGGRDTPAGIIETSEDGLTWTRRTNPLSYLVSEIAVSNG